MRGQLVDGTKTPDSVYLYSYLAYLRQMTTVERNQLMIESLMAGGKQEDGKKNRPQDFARLYDVIIQVRLSHSVEFTHFLDVDALFRCLRIF